MIDAVETALEALIRGAVPDVPAGELGVERVAKLPGTLDVEKLPHVMFGDETERPRLLRFRQQRITVALALMILRRGATHAQMVNDFDAIQAALLLDPTLGGVVDQTTLALDGVREPDNFGDRLSVMTFEAVTVIG